MPELTPMAGADNIFNPIFVFVFNRPTTGAAS
jgi:hypothetical protein